MYTEFMCAAKTTESFQFPALTCDAFTAAMFSVFSSLGVRFMYRGGKDDDEWAYEDVERGRI